MLLLKEYGRTRRRPKTRLIVVSSIGRLRCTRSPSLAIDRHSPLRRFLRLPEPAPDEDFRGYVQRLGTANGYTDETALWRFRNAVKRELNAVGGFRRFAGSIGADENDLSELIGRTQVTSKGTNRADRFARVCFYRDRRKAFCPACISETGIFKAVWNFRAVVVCENHRLWLVDRCSACGKSTTWDGCSVFACKCGFDLRDAAFEQAPMDVSLLTKLLVARLQGRSGADLFLEQRFCDELANISALEWLAMHTFFASTCSGSYGFHVPKAGESKQDRKAISVAARVLQSWPRTTFDEINTCWGALPPGDDDGAPLMSLKRLRDRPPHWYIARSSGALRLPSFLGAAVDQHLSNLIVHSHDAGLAISPSAVALGREGIPALRASATEYATIMGVQAPAESNETCIASFVERLRNLPTGMHSFEEVERLVGATPHQRRVISRCGLLRPMIYERWVPAWELQRFTQWLCDMAASCPTSTRVVSLDALSRQSGSLLQRIIAGIATERVRLFRKSGDVIRLDTCFVSALSVAQLGGGRW
ncbi:TniQ family protein [Paraburkholderia sediminicola]|uniref:TniQ family protein n=1 Tax=Paraburkholderia sediminicola TaxID=458836 RepID=UPI0038BCB623